MCEDCLNALKGKMITIQFQGDGQFIVRGSDQTIDQDTTEGALGHIVDVMAAMREKRQSKVRLN
jgi:hypothetical protein